MPLIDNGPYITSHLTYDAPINEKTKKIREMFKVDEESGYPEHYLWRGMARLGPYYKPEDTFLKFDPVHPDELVSQKVTLVALTALVVGSIHYCIATYKRRSFLSRLWVPIVGTAGISALQLWLQKKTLERQSSKNAILIDYVRKHPERFGMVHRPKFRECLSIYVPIR